MPSAAQMEAFALYVAKAHSWYKHLPLCPPGEAFHFYLDPAAGMDLVLRPGRGIQAEERLARGLHYSAIPTREYRERFGHLACSGASGTTMVMLLADADGTPRMEGDVPRFSDFDVASRLPMPQVVREAGCAYFSGIVHPIGCCPGVLLMECPDELSGHWPDESGGTAALAEIMERAEFLLRGDGSPGRASWESTEGTGFDPSTGLGDPVLTRLIEPELRRQRAGMVAAMRRVVDLVCAGPA